MVIDIKSVSLENDLSDDFDRWLESKGPNEYNRFISELEHIVKDRYNVSTFMNFRPSSDAEQFDNVTIILFNGYVYKFKFVYLYELSVIFSYGVKEAARMYSNVISKGIDSGKAIVSDG